MSLKLIDQSLFFKGRPGDPRLGEFAQPLKFNQPPSQCDHLTLILHGSPDDTGVVRNRGRAGASGGPDAIRTAFYKMAWPLDRQFEKKLRLFDSGNIEVRSDIRITHQHAHRAAAAAAGLGATVIALGGGHDFAAPHFLGWAEGVLLHRLQNTKSKIKTKKTAFGLINIDPHLDVRELEEGLPHSGTPFRQILDSKVMPGSQLIEFGARDGRNAHNHFAYCKKQKVRVRMFEDLRDGKSLVSHFKKELQKLATTASDIAITIDMDCCSELEGVSAAPVLGFSAWELCQIAYEAGRHKKVGFLELAEVAPILDPTGRSARIAAEVLFWFIKGRLELS